MRQSYAPGRPLQSSSQAASAAAQKLSGKKKECEAVIALEQASANFLKRIEELGDDFDVIADAGKVHGQVMEQWPNMFRILGLFLSARQQNSEESEEHLSEDVGERLVRVPVEDLQPSDQPA